LRERPLAWVEFVLFARRYFVVGAGGGVGGVLVPLAGGKVLSRNWSRMPAFMRFVFMVQGLSLYRNC
jgi:H+/gluconate symporter-like permease